MELDEFHIHDFRPGPEGNGYAVPSSYFRVGVMFKKPAQATGGQDHHFTAKNPAGALVPVVGQHAVAGVFPHQQVHNVVVLQNFYVAVLLDAAGQHPLDLGPGGVTAGVQDSPPAVSPLPGQAQALAVAVKDGPQADELPDPVGTFTHQGRHSLRIAQAGPGYKGILPVQQGRVRIPQGGGDAPLGLAGAGVHHGLLGQDSHRTAGPGRGQGSIQPGDAASQDYILIVFLGQFPGVEIQHVVIRQSKSPS
ncbi:MAG: hypothetical protein BWY80_00541 [Firmicutes bacterium ADurb.Bin456]|nr:MAG: hypothetical protein BWY80_00541 [Firmicutes bacterium ADurb.Bin456]